MADLDIMADQDIMVGLAPVTATAINLPITGHIDSLEAIDTSVVDIGISDRDIFEGVTGISAIDTFGAAIGNTLVVDTGEEALGTFGVVVIEVVIVIDD